MILLWNRITAMTHSNFKDYYKFDMLKQPLRICLRYYKSIFLIIDKSMYIKCRFWRVRWGQAYDHLSSRLRRHIYLFTYMHAVFVRMRTFFYGYNWLDNSNILIYKWINKVFYRYLCDIFVNFLWIICNFPIISQVWYNVELRMNSVIFLVPSFLNQTCVQIYYKFLQKLKREHI